MNRHATTFKSWLKLLLVSIVMLLLLGLLVYTFRIRLLTALAGYLTVDEPLQPAEVIFILNGDVHTRPFHTAKLFAEGLAPHIIIAREEESPVVEMGLYPSGTDAAIEVMKELGVPEESITEIIIEGGVTSTYDEAVAFRRYAKQHGLERAILVTSAFHTRRSKWIFDKEWAGSGVELQISAAPQWGYDETSWWQDERGLIMFANEYIKLVYYFAKY